ncbi:protease modulator HflK [Pseudomonas eucalypticola]|uniref:Protease modulator HflK n=1 Tax=Pseudomonas eucalypticola TaxID=2599595 RepID=A0A7D5HSW7_9PSED|nr:protease modulator HflK [Pseudomonas eucalypticola]QKZ07708.1 protease modulator HflK [Pseudomonas eucalypticola]
MRVDLDYPAGDLHALPRFVRAGWQARRLLAVMLGLAGVLGLALLGGIFVELFTRDTLWLPLLCLVSAASLTLLGAVQWAWRIARWREAALKGEPLGGLPVEWVQDDPQSGYDRLLNRLSDTALVWVERLGVGALWLMAASGVALLLVRYGWNLALVPHALGQTAYVLAGLALVLAFGLLVLERHLSATDAVEWPEASGLALQLRITLASLLLAAVCLFFASSEAVWPLRLAVLAGLLPALAALELLVRALLSVFNPQRPALEPHIVADSLVAGLLHWPPRPLGRLQDEMQQRFGIDLRQIWALGFMRRASLPVLSLIAVVGWLLSGVTQVPMNGRGVYEQFGKPVTVYGPGLHVGLPWPFGQVRDVENGVIHELATSAEGSSDEPAVSADGPAPVSANRLWDASHRAEKSQVIASQAGDQQSFQVVNMDVRFVYRIGLSDQAALAATYNSADVPALIRSTASRVLVHQLAGRELDDMLGETRAQLGEDIGKQVQADLDRLNSGVELLATVVEAIHPPAGAADAYHGVQAAQISAQALIARERGNASVTGNQARTDASLATDNAQAGSAETLGTAKAADLRFGAELQAWHSAGQAFIDEQYFSQLAKGLVNAKALILDHRIARDQPPTLDLRTFAAPVDPAQPRP